MMNRASGTIGTAAAPRPQTAELEPLLDEHWADGGPRRGRGRQGCHLGRWRQRTRGEAVSARVEPITLARTTSIGWLATAETAPRRRPRACSPTRQSERRLSRPAVLARSRSPSRRSRRSGSPRRSSPSPPSAPDRVEAAPEPELVADRAHRCAKLRYRRGPLGARSCTILTWIWLLGVWHSTASATPAPTPHSKSLVRLPCGACRSRWLALVSRSCSNVLKRTRHAWREEEEACPPLYSPSTPVVRSGAQSSPTAGELVAAGVQATALHCSCSCVFTISNGTSPSSRASP